MVWARIEKRRRIRRQESDGDGGAGQKKEEKTKAEVDGYNLSEKDRAKWRSLIRHIDPT